MGWIGSIFWEEGISSNSWWSATEWNVYIGDGVPAFSVLRHTWYPPLVWSWRVFKRPLQCFCFVYPVLPHTHRCAYIQKDMENPPGFQTFLVTLESKKGMEIDSLEAKIRFRQPFGNIWGALWGLRGWGNGLEYLWSTNWSLWIPIFRQIFGPGPPKSAQKYGFWVI